MILIVSLVSTAQLSRAAGVTIITHGFQLPGPFSSPPTWVSMMGAAIDRRIGTAGNTATYNAEIGYVGYPNIGLQSFNYEGGYNPAYSDNAEVILKLYWYKVGDQIVDAVNASEIANVIVPYLLANNITDTGGYSPITHPLAQMPIHLIGHSRGGSVVSEIARLLGEKGIWVDHVTTLDPHPVNDGFTVDPQVGAYTNTVFFDNYYETDYLYPWPCLDLVDRK